jgi:tetratricopeptide (TPR) repeat protein
MIVKKLRIYCLSILVILLITKLPVIIILNFLNLCHGDSRIRENNIELSDRYAGKALHLIAKWGGESRGVYSAAARTALHFGEYETAIDLLASTTPKTVQDELNLADAYFALGFWREATQQYYVILSKSDVKFYPVGKWLLSCAHWKRLDVNELGAFCPQISSYLESVKELYTYIGHRGRADWQIEPEILSELVEVGVITPEVVRDYLSYIYWRGEYSVSLRLVDSLVAVTDADEDKIWLAKILVNLGLDEQALTILRSISTASPFYQDAEWLRGRIFELQGDSSVLDNYCQNRFDTAVYWPCIQIVSHQINSNMRHLLRLNGKMNQTLGENLLSNGGFEEISDTTPADWDWHIWTSSWMGIATLNDGHFMGGIDTIDGLKGNALRLQAFWVDTLPGKSKARAGYVSRTVSVSSDELYYLSLFYRTQSAPTTALLWGARHCGYEEIILADTNGQWRHAEILMRIPSCLEEFRLFLLVFTPGVVWFDQVSFLELKAIPSRYEKVQFPYLEIH